MRLGQLARKVNKNQDEVRRFIEKEFKVELNHDPNVKIEEDHMNAVIAEFYVEEVVEEKPIKAVEAEKVEEPVQEEPKAEEPVAEETPEIEEDIVTEEVNEEVAVAETEEVEETTSEVEEQVEETEEELDPFIERPVDPDAELIKAPKVELEGFKVVGKIDLPVEKVVEEEAEEVSTEGVDELEASMQAINQDVKTAKVAEASEVAENLEKDEEAEENSIYKDAKGIYHFSQEQLDNRAKFFEAKKEKERLEREKEKKKRHYEEMMAQSKKDGTPKKAVKGAPTKKPAKKKPVETKQEPTTVWGKFLRWLND